MRNFFTVPANPVLVLPYLLYHSKQVLCATENATALAPLSLPPSQYWDGVDGPWSSFGILVGTPPQNIRVLPSTSGDSPWVVLQEGCSAPGDPSNCPSTRGFVFHISNSTTWIDQGLYQLSLHTESLLGYSGNARYGFDNVTLGWQGDGLPSLNHSVVAGIATKDFYIGTLGLKPQPVHFDTFNNPQPSMLQTLRTQKKIPSSSWSYTAGSYNQQPKMFGSLTIGGYDASRFVPNNVSFPFGPDGSRDLSVGIQSITSDSTSSPLLPSGIYAFIDSLVPHIWLPLEACQAFEQAFGLTWDDLSALYVVDDSLHSKLVKLNANVTFKLGPSLVGGSTVDITLPYRSFDLAASPPFLKNSNATRHFPLRRAQNDSQYTLGRAFLQHAYVIADYDRETFSVSEALFLDVSVPKKLMAIFPPGEGPPNNNHPGLGTGAIAGIVVGSILIILCVIALLVHWHHRRIRRAAGAAVVAAKEAEDLQYRKAELDTMEVMIHHADSNNVLELDTSAAADGGPALPHELCGLASTSTNKNLHLTAHELPAEDVLLPELSWEPASSAKMQATQSDVVHTTGRN